MAQVFNEVLTPRLRLVRPTPADFADLFAMHNDPRVSPTLGGPMTEDVGLAKHRANLAHWEQYGFGYWVARDRATGQFLGRGGLRHIQLGGRDEVEVGYGFRPEAWGKGHATELAAEAVRIGLDMLQLDSLVAIALPTNIGSRRVMEKVGFNYECDCDWAGLPHVQYRLRPTFEIVRPFAPMDARVVLFDWDGTLSLLREGWPDIMTRQMLDVLHDPSAVEEIVVGLNGRPTIVQMQRLAELATQRGIPDADPKRYLAEYQSRLFAMVGERYDDITSGRAPQRHWTTPGTRELISELRSRGLPILVLSGTARDQVRREIELLGLESSIDELLAPDGDDPRFNKHDEIAGVLQRHGISGSQVLSFGDGVVETEAVKKVGGVAIAVASEPPPKRGANVRKREALIRAGADAVIGDFAVYPKWLPRVLAER